MKEKHLGVRFLIEVGMSMVESIFPNIDPTLYDQLTSVLERYLRGNYHFEDAKKIFIHILGRFDPLQQIRDIILLTDDPILPDEDKYGESDDDPLSRKKRNTWTNYEDQRLIAGIYRFGLDNWSLVADFVGNNRTRAQCAQRWSRGLNPRICKNHWTEEESAQLLSLVKKYGEKAWTKIAQCLGNRSDVQCRYHYKHLSKDNPQYKQALENSNETAIQEQQQQQPPMPQYEQITYSRQYVHNVPQIPVYPHAVSHHPMQQMYSPRIESQKIAQLGDKICLHGRPFPFGPFPIVQNPMAIPIIVAPSKEQYCSLDHFLGHF